MECPKPKLPLSLLASGRDGGSANKGRLRFSVAGALIVLWSGCPESSSGPEVDEDSGMHHGPVLHVDGGHHEDPEPEDAGDAGSHTDGGTSPQGDAGAPPTQAGDAPNDSNGSDHGNQPPQGHFFLPTGEPMNTAEPSLEIDAQDTLHMVYPSYGQPRAFYATYERSAKRGEDVKLVEFETEGTVSNAMLALTEQGQPRILLATFTSVYYAACDRSCSLDDNWTFARILDHQGEKDVTGEAFGLDASGRPRFVLHTKRALNGIGQKQPETHYAQCDASCEDGASWRFDVIDPDSMYVGASLRFDARNRAHLATSVITTTGSFPALTNASFGYYQCAGACSTQAEWSGAEFSQPYEDLTTLVSMKPTISLALTKTGAPRMLVMSKSQTGAKQLVYIECDDNCISDVRGKLVGDNERMANGIDLALDQNDRPRFVFNLDYNIAAYTCDAQNCAAQDVEWTFVPVEKSSEIPKDTIILKENCTVAGWFMHDPSLAVTSDGKLRVGYQIRDVSGGLSQPDPTKPRCRAGTDMTWSRLAILE